MTTITAERSTQALTEIAGLITAIAGVQALIQAGVESPFCPYFTAENLGKAYWRLSESLADAATKL